MKHLDISRERYISKSNAGLIMIFVAESEEDKAQMARR
jgi:hypothetical protein